MMHGQLPLLCNLTLFDAVLAIIIAARQLQEQGNQKNKHTRQDSFLQRVTISTFQTCNRFQQLMCSALIKAAVAIS